MNENDLYLPPSILIVDDEPELIDILIDDLSDIEGLKIYTAPNVDQALLIIDQNVINIILSDITMPDKSGIDFCRTVRGKGYDIPFIFVTGYESREYLHAAIGLGATDFLEKPYEKSQLIDIIWKSIYITQKQREINSAIDTLAAAHEHGDIIRNKIEREQHRIGLVKAAKTKGKKIS